MNTHVEQDFQEQYVVSVQDFRGPIDLLHQLIEKRKLQINAISLSEITKDFLNHIKNTALVPEEVSRFLHIASILILIKSKSLLPILDYTDEESADVELLQYRVKLYTFLKNNAVPMFVAWKPIVKVATLKKKKEIEFSPDESCTVDNLHRKSMEVIQDLSFLKKAPQKRVSVVLRIEEVIEKVMSTIESRVSVSFSEITCKENKAELVVSFLAVLELARKNLLGISQEDNFGDIVLHKQKT